MNIIDAIDFAEAWADEQLRTELHRDHPAEYAEALMATLKPRIRQRLEGRAEAVVAECKDEMRTLLVRRLIERVVDDEVNETPDDHLARTLLKVRNLAPRPSREEDVSARVEWFDAVRAEYRNQGVRDSAARAQDAYMRRFGCSPESQKEQVRRGRRQLKRKGKATLPIGA